jgi:hypothetical protein
VQPSLLSVKHDLQLEEDQSHVERYYRSRAGSVLGKDLDLKRISYDHDAPGEEG